MNKERIVEVANKTRRRELDKRTRTIAEEALDILKIKTGELSIVLTGEKKIKELNRKWRKRNEVTDVLSFSLRERGEKNAVFGELFVCLKQVERQARAADRKFVDELIEMVVHGILHLTGLDHEKDAAEAKKMLRLQERISQRIKSQFKIENDK